MQLLEFQTLFLGCYCFLSTKFTVLPLVGAQQTQIANLKDKRKAHFNSKTDALYFTLQILGSQTNPFVFVSRFALPTSQVRYKKQNALPIMI